MLMVTDSDLMEALTTGLFSIQVPLALVFGKGSRKIIKVSHSLIVTVQSDWAQFFKVTILIQLGNQLHNT